MNPALLEFEKQAMLSLGGKLDYFIETTFNYSTLAEAYKIAALNAWNRMSAAQTNKTEIKVVLQKKNQKRFNDNI